MKKQNFILKILIVTMLLPATVVAQSLPAGNQQTLPQTQTQSLSQQTAFTQTAAAPTPCTFATVGKPNFQGKFLAIKKPSNIQPGQIFTMQVFMENTGNVPWFSENSGCNSMTVVHLGTENDRDRASPFYTTAANPDPSIMNTWLGASHIKMDNKRVSPLQTASFTITAQAPADPGIYREFYAPVAEGVGWMDGDALFSQDINVGNASLDPSTAEYMTYIEKSANLSTLKLDGGKNIIVSLSQQRMYVKIGDTIIRTFPVSTGAPMHPTPVGSYNIILKQTVRVAVSTPHYIMPLFQEFKNGGYGIHALPSLGNDHGIFWREALNHIGSPKSHGCIRLLPDDAVFVWNFTDVGTPMSVRW